MLIQTPVWAQCTTNDATDCECLNPEETDCDLLPDIQVSWFVFPLLRMVLDH